MNDENILWNSQSILECMGWRWRTLDLVWLYTQQLWRSWTFHYFYSFLFILHLKDILWLFFTYEKINSWPPRNRLSGTVRLLKERSLQHSIKLVTIWYRDTNKGTIYWCCSWKCLLINYFETKTYFDDQTAYLCTSEKMFQMAT